jgi:hypothetical protein
VSNRQHYTEESFLEAFDEAAAYQDGESDDERIRRMLTKLAHGVADVMSRLEAIGDTAEKARFGAELLLERTGRMEIGA